MSIEIIGGAIVTVSETELECPICTGVSDFSRQMDRAKYPAFNTKCPKCKGKVYICIPIMGGTTTIQEADEPKIKGHEPKINVSRFMINGVPIDPKNE